MRRNWPLRPVTAYLTSFESSALLLDARLTSTFFVCAWKGPSSLCESRRSHYWTSPLNVALQTKPIFHAPFVDVLDLRLASFAVKDSPEQVLRVKSYRKHARQFALLDD